MLSIRSNIRIGATLSLVFIQAAVVGCGGGSGSSPSQPTQPPPATQSNASCLERANFGDPAQSAYVLPYPVGEAYEAITSYCSSFTYPDNIGIDFDIPQGASVSASRGGTVLEVVDRFEDSNVLGRSNRILIEHGNGSMAFYLHLEQDSAVVRVGDSVKRGELLAHSAASGAPFAHLHFTVFRTARLEDSIAAYLRRTDSLPINFSNTDGPLDERGGLVAGAIYEALPY